MRLARDDEHSEAYDIYPAFAKIAKEEGFKEIERLFLMVADVEKCHSMLFGQLFEQMKKGTMYKRKTAIKWKCAGCGYEGTTKSAPDECPLCKAKQGFFMLHIEDGSDQPAK
ncbi:MAG: rubrerythrin family protein [Clostridia bacterium]|nr:rubrerythrin family protein [Clostridia bacterium]